MQRVSICLALCSLSMVWLGCANDDDDDDKTGTNSHAGVGTGAADAGKSDGSDAGAGMSDAGAPGSVSAEQPQGSCPDGFRCTPVPVGENQRACIAPGELFAPSCNVAADCTKLPGAVCLDPGFGFGSLCALRCTP